MKVEYKGMVVLDDDEPGLGISNGKLTVGAGDEGNECLVEFTAQETDIIRDMLLSLEGRKQWTQST